MERSGVLLLQTAAGPRQRSVQPGCHQQPPPGETRSPLGAGDYIIHGHLGKQLNIIDPHRIQALLAGLYGKVLFFSPFPLLFASKKNVFFFAIEWWDGSVTESHSAHVTQKWKNTPFQKKKKRKEKPRVKVGVVPSCKFLRNHPANEALRQKWLLQSFRAIAAGKQSTMWSWSRKSCADVFSAGRREAGCSVWLACRRLLPSSLDSFGWHLLKVDFIRFPQDVMFYLEGWGKV